MSFIWASKLTNGKKVSGRGKWRMKRFTGLMLTAMILGGLANNFRFAKWFVPAYSSTSI